MNDKTAKRVRQLAKQVANTISDELRPTPEQSYVLHRKGGYIVNHPLGVKGIYRRLKKEIRRGRNMLEMLHE